LNPNSEFNKDLKSKLFILQNSFDYESKKAISMTGVVNLFWLQCIFDDILLNAS